MRKIKFNVKVVENFKYFISVALVVILAGIIVMCTAHLNLGLDFSGGAEIEVRLDSSSVANHETEIESHIRTEIIEGEEGNSSKLETAGETRTSHEDGEYVMTFRVAYKLNGEKVTDETSFIKVLTEGDDSVQQSIINYYNGLELGSDISSDDVSIHATTATTERNSIYNAVIAISVAIVAMLIYIAIRFKPVAGLAAILALVHDVLVMFSFTAIFQIEINSTFIAAIITIIGYSINATIVLFDRIRELEKSSLAAGLDDSGIVNKAISDTFTRSVYTTITTLITIVLIAVFGVSAIRQFALPIIFGLIAGAYSSILLSGSFWVLFRKLFKHNQKGSGYKALAKDKTAK